MFWEKKYNYTERGKILTVTVIGKWSMNNYISVLFSENFLKFLQWTFIIYFIMGMEVNITIYI